jgi:hypothetical protein
MNSSSFFEQHLWREHNLSMISFSICALNSHPNAFWKSADRKMAIPKMGNDFEGVNFLFHPLTVQRLWF